MTEYGTQTLTLPTYEQILSPGKFHAPKHLCKRLGRRPRGVKRWLHRSAAEVTVDDIDLRVAAGKWRYVRVAGDGFEVGLSTALTARSPQRA